MKQLFGATLIWMIIVSFIVFVDKVAAEVWFPVGKAGAKTTYVKKSYCETTEQQLCYEVKGLDLRYHEVETVQENDLTKPIYKAPYNVENCDSVEDCSSKMPNVNASCGNGDYSEYQKNAVLPGYTVFCTGVSGYEQKTVNRLKINQALKDSIEAADSSESQKESQIKTMQKHVAFGQRMIAYIGARNASKGLTTAQVKQIVQTYSSVQDLLASGSLLTAKEEIEAITPDGTLITQEDKDALLSEMNSYLGL